jgi:endo-1,4-beta-D-glucanase Y
MSRKIWSNYKDDYIDQPDRVWEVGDIAQVGINYLMLISLKNGRETWLNVTKYM